MRGPTLAFGVFVLFNACSVMQAYSSESSHCDAGSGSGCTANEADAGWSQQDAGTTQRDNGCASSGYTGGFSGGDATYGGETVDATQPVGDDCGADHDMDADATGPEARSDSSADAVESGVADGEASVVTDGEQDAGAADAVGE